MNPTLPFMPSDGEHLTLSELETWLQAQPALIRSTTLFHWWPQRLSKRRRPWRT